MLPFTVLEPTCGQSCRHDHVHEYRPGSSGGWRSVFTWYAHRVQRTGLNTEAKLLLLRHAFVELHCIAVELRTHFMNHQSRRAIERLGAKLDGVLRCHSLASKWNITRHMRV